MLMLPPESARYGVFWFNGLLGGSNSHDQCIHLYKWWKVGAKIMSEVINKRKGDQRSRIMITRSRYIWGASPRREKFWRFWPDWLPKTCVRIPWIKGETLQMTRQPAVEDQHFLQQVVIVTNMRISRDPRGMRRARSSLWQDGIVSTRRTKTRHETCMCASKTTSNKIRICNMIR